MNSKNLFLPGQFWVLQSPPDPLEAFFKHGLVHRKRDAEPPIFTRHVNGTGRNHDTLADAYFGDAPFPLLEPACLWTAYL